MEWESGVNVEWETGVNVEWEPGVNVEWEPGVNVEWESGVFSLGTWVLCSLVPHAYKLVTSLIGIL